MNIQKIKAGICMDLHRRGHSTEDIEKMTPEESFDEWCNWHGLIEWGPKLRGVLKNLQEAAK